jgi:hypothetical protein
MLSDRDREILTAFVDSELSNRQRRYVARLLHRSAEARQLLEKLKEDSGELQRLEPPALETDLALPVLRTIAERHLAIRRQTEAHPVGGYPVWLGAVVAAAAFLVVVAGSYLYFTHTLSRDDSARLAHNQKAPPAPEARQPPAETPRVVEKPREDSAREPTPSQPNNPPSQPPTQVVQRPVEKPAVPETSAPKGEPVLTAPSMEMFKLETASVALPVTVKLRELDQEANRKKLLSEWKQDAAFRIELPCKDGTRAFERFQKVWKEKGNSLLIDQVAQGRLKQPRFKTNYVVVAEDLTPEELLQMMRQLAAEDKKGESKRPPDVQFDSLVVTRLTKGDHKELSELLGVDFAAAGTGQGAARPETDKAVKAPEHHALALAYNPVRPRPGSAEVKRFLDSRKPVRPGTVQVLLVLRGPGS